jgi:transposase-like protein
MKLPLTRRGVIGSIVAGGALISTRLMAAPVDRPINLVIVQHSLRSAIRRELVARQAGVPMIELQRDVVRQWRDGLGDSVERAMQAVAYVPWAQAQILVGLMREAGGAAQIADFAPQLFEVALTLTPIGRKS